MAHLNTIAAQARQLLRQHGLHDWTFDFDRSVKRFGCCSHRDRKITLSRRLTEANSEAEAHDVILHEIAHALVGYGAGHGPTWKAAARRIGARPERCYSSDNVVPVAKYVAWCRKCAKVVGSRQKSPGVGGHRHLRCGGAIEWRLNR